MTPNHERLHDVVSAAVTRAGVRAAVQSGWAGLEPAGDDILLVGDLPHDWLFPRTAAVVHDAGAGTTAAGLRAAVPAVPVPVRADDGPAAVLSLITQLEGGTGTLPVSTTDSCSTDENGVS